MQLIRYLYDESIDEKWKINKENFKERSINLLEIINFVTLIFSNLKKYFEFFIIKKGVDCSGGTECELH